ncbi:MAG: hypothetical protein HC916_15875 [Coleofasciculaceae cyanobacterium SM2_1_6]|nr:hypothetical protein [Coleofasciculaceae cyanobacterium SM2_1_6]
MRSPDQEPETPETPETPTQPRTRRRWWRILAVTSLVTVGGGALGGWIFVDRYLSGIIQDSVVQAIDRPVELGRVEGFSISSIRFGETLIPATDQDRDQVKVEAIEANFNLLELVISRRLNLDLQIIQPEVYLEQDPELNWINLDIKSGEEESAIKVEVDRLTIINADVTLVARDIENNLAPAVPLQLNTATAEFLEDNQRIIFDLEGQLRDDRKFQVNGESLPNQGNTNLVVSGNQILARELGYLLPLPFQLVAGQVNGNLEIQLKANESPEINGNASLENVVIKEANLPQNIEAINGELSFLGQAIRLENIRAELGEISAQAQGLVDLNSGFDVQITTTPFEINEGLNVFQLKDTPVDLQGRIQTNLAVTGQLDQPIINGQLVNVGNVRVDRLNLATLRTNFRLVNQILSFSNLNAIPDFNGIVGGLINGNGNLRLDDRQDFNLDLGLTNFPLRLAARLYDLDLPLNNPLISANTNLTGSLKDLTNLQGLATAQTIINSSSFNNTNNNIGVTTNIQVNQGVWRALVQANNLELALEDSEFLREVQPNINGELILTGRIDNFEANSIRGDGLLAIVAAGGTITASDIQLNQGNLQTQIRARNLQLNNLSSLPVELRNSTVAGDFLATVNLNDLQNLQLRGITATGNGELTIAGGVVTAEGIQIQNGNWQTRAIARSIQVDRLATVPAQFAGSNLNGEFTLGGSLDNFDLATITAQGFANLGLAGGNINVTNAELSGGNFRARVVPVGLEIRNFVNTLSGQLDGSLQVFGNINNLSPRGIQAVGSINLPQGIAGVERPIGAGINWNGQRLVLDSPGERLRQRATAEDLDVRGFADLNFDTADIVARWDLDIDAANINLQNLPITLPAPATLMGRGDFQGRVTGNLTNPQITGALQVRDLVSTGLAFEPLLRGTVNANQTGVNLQLAGTQDRIEANLSPQFLPESFLVVRGETIATGRVEANNLLAVNLQNFPVTTLRPLVAGTPLAGRAIGGSLSGDGAVNLRDFSAVGTIAVQEPVINTLRGDSFTADFALDRESIRLTQSVFRRGIGEYRLTGVVNQFLGTPQIQASAQITNGDVQDILTALQIFELRDIISGNILPIYGTAADLGRLNAGSPEPTLTGQLRRLSELQELLAQQQETRRQENFDLPELSNFAGKFNGTVTANGSPPTGINADFNLAGGDWVWGNYQLQQVQVEGNFRNNVLTLLPLELRSGDRVVSYQGTIGGAEQSGQLIVEKVPVALLSQLFQLPDFFGVTGEISSITTLSGSIDNPRARGAVNVTQATLNQIPVQAVEASFSYFDSRLRFGTNVSIAESNSGQQSSPLTLNGNIPYQLPFASTAPSDNQLRLNLQVQNQELAILDLLSQGQVAWGGGEGDVQLEITGEIDQSLTITNLVADGSALFRDAVLKIQVLPSPLTKINGSVAFNFDQINIENLRGELGGGEVSIAGSLPIFNPSFRDNPLTVNLDNLALNLPDLYSGGVQGNVVVTGTALAPRIGGSIEVFDGQVLLTVPEATAASPGNPPNNNPGLRPELNDLRLVLGRNIQLNLPPVLGFVADGGLVVNGPLDNLQPQGIINIQRGRVNLFTSEFRLAGGYDHTAQFFPERGLDPFLNVRLATSVEESTGRRLPTNESLSEIREQPLSIFGTVQTVRIEARVNGYASELSDRLELNSSPRRSQQEIIALLGGNFIDSFSQGNTTIGLANLASSALLSNFQNQISDALGLASFRLFPTTINDRGQINTTLGLGAEIGLDITPAVSISALRILTANQPFQYSLRYRINENLLLRGSSNLAGDNRVLIEFETRY